MVSANFLSQKIIEKFLIFLNFWFQEISLKWEILVNFLHQNFMIKYGIFSTYFVAFVSRKNLPCVQ